MVVTVSPPGVINQLDVVEDIGTRLVTCVVDSAFDALTFEQLKKALCDGVVVTVSSSAHGAHQLVCLDEALPFMAGVLAALIGMNQ